MSAQIWLWAVLSGLGIGVAGWCLRGWMNSGREMRLKRAYEARLCSVEEDAKRSLARARQQAARDRRRLEATIASLEASLADRNAVPPAAVAFPPDAPAVDRGDGVFRWPRRAVLENGSFHRVKLEDRSAASRLSESA